MPGVAWSLTSCCRCPYATPVSEQGRKLTRLSEARLLIARRNLTRATCDIPLQVLTPEVAKVAVFAWFWVAAEVPHHTVRCAELAGTFPRSGFCTRPCI